MVDDFIKKYQGKTVCFPEGKYCGECLSLCKQYILENLGIYPPPSGTNSAYGYWSRFPSPLGEVFEKVKNTPNGVPQKGDLVIWNTNAGGGFGHIAIFVEGNANKFTSFDANWNGRQAHLQGHYYNNVVGWLHAKGEPMDCLLKNDEEGKKTFEELVRTSSLYREFEKKGYETVAYVDQKIQEMRSSLDEAKTDKEHAEAEAHQYQNLYRNLIKTLADEDHLNTTQDADKVVAEAAKVGACLAQLEDLERNFAALKTQSEADKSKLKAEIAVLKEKLKSGKEISQVEAVELVRELIRRLSTIVTRK